MSGIAERPSIAEMSFSRLRNDAHIRFHAEFRGLVEEAGPGRLKIEALWPGYVGHCDNLDAAHKNIVRSAAADKIKNADIARNAVFSGLAKLHTVMCEHFDPVVRDAAHRVQSVLHTYSGIADKSMDEKTGAINNLVRELKSGRNSVLVTIAGLTPWVNKLAQLNGDFETLTQERDRETMSQNPVDMKTARHEADEAYRRIVEAVNSSIHIKELTDCDAFVNKLNEIINRFSIKYPHYGYQI